MSALRWAIVGVAVAAVALLSPLTAWFALAIVPIVACTTRGLDRDERRWVVALTALAIVLRVVVVVALFLSTDHSQVPFGTFFGDEDYFIKRSLWVRNVGLGFPVHAIDLELAAVTTRTKQRFREISGAAVGASPDRHARTHSTRSRIAAAAVPP